MELYFIFVGLVNICVGASIKQQILDDLLQNSSYDKRVPPGTDFGEIEEERPTNISVSINITEIYDINVDDMDFSVTLYLTQTWLDHRLIFEHSNIKFIQLERDNFLRVWTPDTFFAGSKNGFLQEVTKPNTLMTIYSNGTVIYTMRLNLKLSCNMDFHLYPLDKQECKLHLESYGFTFNRVLYFWEENDPLHIWHINLPLYIVKKHPSTETQTTYLSSNSEFKYSALIATIYLERALGYYLTEIFIPDGLIVVLSWVSFWLHPDAVPGRVSLGAVTVLTMSSQSSASRRHAPKVSYVKALDVWTLCHVLFVFGAMVEFSIVNVLARRKQYIETNGITSVVNNDRRPFYDKAKRIDIISRVAFPAGYVVFNALFWIIVTHIQD